LLGRRPNTLRGRSDAFVNPFAAVQRSHDHAHSPGSAITGDVAAAALCWWLDRATTRLLIQGESQLLILEEQLCQQQLQPTDPRAKIPNHFRSSF
jgi:hypothetical protein